jgi:very-short-patch-repair endonuclease
MDSGLASLKMEFREFCVNNMVLRDIGDIFSAVGLQPGTVNSPFISGSRRTLVEAYYSSIDWNNPADVKSFLKAIEFVLIQSYVPEDSKNKLRNICTICGFEIDKNGHTLYLTSAGIGRQFKNLIFAADGPKPEIVLSDAVSNDIEIVKNAEYCLVYDRPIKRHGLLWSELIDWWRNINQGVFPKTVETIDIERKLYARLRKSLGSKEEELIYKTYFKYFRQELTEKLPALIPQVYLHYDPYTLRQRQFSGDKQLPRQRMDFLLLLSDQYRIVIEVDGMQHYSEIDTDSQKYVASSKLYAEMVSEDRKLRLADYEVYRFGVSELKEINAENLIYSFFRQLFEKYSLLDKIK